jgi:extradiol dioxygenase family protein
MGEWQALADRLTDAGIEFVIEPHIRFRGQAGEQGTFFITDPSGNAIELKGFADPGQLFAR